MEDVVELSIEHKFRSREEHARRAVILAKGVRPNPGGCQLERRSRSSLEIANLRRDMVPCLLEELQPLY